MISQQSQLLRVVLSAAFAAGLIVVPLAQGDATGPQVLKNPYADVDWDHVNQYKANFHSHTIYSDGRAEPDQLIHNYAEAGYDILAVTDHDNYHTTREGERETVPTTSPTWPWTNWIPERPSQIWHRGGIETSAFYPDLGERGMLAIRGNELTTHPHIVSLFNDCGFPDRDQTEGERMDCIAEKGGLSYWAHPADYVPGGRWEDNVVDTSWEEAADYFGEYIAGHEHKLGIEMQLGGRLERERELLGRLLETYYRDHDLFIMGSDDSHSTSVSSSAVITIVLAEELTEEAVRRALKRGHNFVGERVDAHPQFNGIAVDEEANTITLDIEHHDSVTWIKNGEIFHEGEALDYSAVEDAILRFEVNVGDAVFYSQAFHIG